MKTNNETILSVFKGKTAADRALTALREQGFAEGDMSAVLPRRDGEKDFQIDTSRQLGFSAVLGGFLGAACGVLVAAVIVFFFNYNQEFLSPWALSAFVILFGAFFGALSTSLVRFGTPDPVVNRYAHYLDDGGVLVGLRNVESDERKTKGMKILEEVGGAEIHAFRDVHHIWQRIFSKSGEGDTKRRSGRTRFYNHSHP